MDRDLDRRIRSLAATQQQVVACAQVRALGASEGQLARRKRSPEWEMPTPRVLRLAGSPDTFEQQCMIAVLDTGGVISGETCLALFNVTGFARTGPIRVTRMRGGTRRQSSVAKIHEVKLLPDHHCLRVNGIPAVTPTRAIFDIAARRHWKRVQRTLNNAWRFGLTSGPRVYKMGTEWPKRGRTGSAAMRLLLKITPIDFQPTASNLEDRFLSILEDAGFPTPVKQADTGDDARWIGRVDFRDSEVPLIAEVNSDTFHTAPLDLEADERRYKDLTAAGFRVEPFTEHEVWHEPAVVRRRWGEARANLRAKPRGKRRDSHAGSDGGEVS